MYENMNVHIPVDSKSIICTKDCTAKPCRSMSSVKNATSAWEKSADKSTELKYSTDDFIIPKYVLFTSVLQG